MYIYIGIGLFLLVNLGLVWYVVKRRADAKSKDDFDIGSLFLILLFFGGGKWWK